MKTILFGLTGFGNSALRALQKADCDVAAVFTRAEKGLHPYYPEQHLSVEARTLGIKVYEDFSLKEESNKNVIRNINPDLIICATYNRILPDSVLSIPKYAINFHPSLLPAYKGTTPISWVLVYGEKETGITAHLMTSKLDAGDILYQQKIKIGERDTNGTLRRKLAGLLKKMIPKVIEGVKYDNFNPIPQSASKIYPKFTNCFVNLSGPRPIKSIDEWIRAATPYPGAFTYLGNTYSTDCPKSNIISSNILNGKQLVIQTKEGITITRNEEDFDCKWSKT